MVIQGASLDTHYGQQRVADLQITSVVLYLLYTMAPLLNKYFNTLSCKS